jgi:AIG2-like family.
VTPELVFVYGTLTDDSQVAELLDSYRFVGNADCLGLSRIDGRYPTLVPGERVSGRLLETSERERLDRYEGVESGLYHRFSLPVKPESGVPVEHDEASVYIGAPAGLGIDPSPEQHWPRTGAFPERVDAYLSAHAVRIVKK